MLRGAVPVKFYRLTHISFIVAKLKKLLIYPRTCPLL